MYLLDDVSKLLGSVLCGGREASIEKGGFLQLYNVPRRHLTLTLTLTPTPTPTPTPTLNPTPTPTLTLTLTLQLFQGASRVECTGFSSDCAASLATLLLPLYTHEADSLLVSMLTTLARQPGLGRFLCAFQGNTSTVHHNGGVYYGKKVS